MKIRGKLLFFGGMTAALTAGWVAFPYALYERAAQPLQFNHAVHMGEKGGMKCEDCHAIREDGSFAGIPALDKCAGCHSTALGTTAAEKQLVDKYVANNHEIPWQVYARQPENVYFPHAPHVKLAKLACAECHGDHGKTTGLRPYERNRISGYSRDIWGRNIVRIGSAKRPGMKMADCIDCHRTHNLTHSCMECHK